MEKDKNLYDIHAAEEESEELSKRTQSGIAGDYQEANSQVDAENAAKMREELLALTGAEKPISFDEIKQFMGEESFPEDSSTVADSDKSAEDNNSQLR